MTSILFSARSLVLLVGLAASLLVPVTPAAADPSEFRLSFPQDPIVTEFVDSFGFARSGGRRHHGTDLMAPKMTPVFAAADGVVSSVGEGGTAGRRVTIEHEDGYETWYLHLNNDTPGTDDGAGDWSQTLAPGIEEDVEVRAGELIGWVGDSGNAEGTAPHTHFELHRDGEVLNPYPYLAPAQRSALLRLAVLDTMVRSAFIR